MWDAAAGRKIRVAFVVGEYPPEERKRREDAALAYSSAEVEVGIVSVKATPYFIGNAPDLLGVAVPPFLDAFREAERQGYDAVVPLGTLDLGVDAGRCVVDIPVVGPSESMLHIASMLGPPLRHHHVRRLRHSARLPHGRALPHDRQGDRLAHLRVRAAGHHRQPRQGGEPAFVDKARELVKLGADVILPMGITQCPVHIKPDWLMKELGVPVVEGHRRADPARRHAGEPQAQLQPRVLAEVGVGEGEVGS